MKRNKIITWSLIGLVVAGYGYQVLSDVLSEKFGPGVYIVDKYGQMLTGIKGGFELISQGSVGDGLDLIISKLTEGVVGTGATVVLGLLIIWFIYRLIMRRKTVKE
jgi:hypothetical protein